MTDLSNSVNGSQVEEDEELLPSLPSDVPEEDCNVVVGAPLEPSMTNGDANLVNPETNVMTMAELVNERYTQFNKSLLDLSALVDSFTNDKKTIRAIQAEYVKVYERFFDVIKHIYGLDMADPTVKPGKTADRILFKREVLEPKRVIDKSGEKLLIYTDKDGKYRFIDETFANGEGISLNDLAFWVENRANFVEGDISVQNSPVCITIFGKTVFIPVRGLRLSGAADPVEDRFWAIISRIYKTLGALIIDHRETKK